MTHDTEYMPDKLFQELADSAQLMVDIENGKASLAGLKTHAWSIVDVKRVRQALPTKTNQTQFAELIGVGVDLVKSWESGRRNPSGSSSKLLGLLDKYPNLASELS